MIDAATSTDSNLHKENVIPLYFIQLTFKMNNSLLY